MGTEVELIPKENAEIVRAAGAGGLLDRVRPAWQSKQLIERVKRILPIDPSSACQRIFNAAIHDLREKIVVAGIDIATEAAEQNKLPPISKAEDIESYSTSKVIDLAYRMGLLSRPEWRKLLRAYDIRKDLEHEDDEYEADVEDCLYMFKTCIEIVLEKDPVQLIKLVDIKDIVSIGESATLTDVIVEEFSHAPSPRQLEIYKFLISYSLDDGHPDVVRENCYQALSKLRPYAQTNVLIECALHMIERVGKKRPLLVEFRVAYISGLLPYLKKAQIREFYSHVLTGIKDCGYRWERYDRHGDLLRNIQEVGGLNHCPDELLKDFVEWLVLCYIGTPGGLTRYGNVRQVFYSNVGAPLALELLANTTKQVSKMVADMENDSKEVRTALRDEHVARRFHSILDKLDN
ncbi:hypothetical protein [Sneathiella litorea]|uniref:Uncharacterized protein n=1 Tax=Sneathiella litorea TaxID=2606216 RepID=A0A6L8WBY9_9PROT|nr:hypothetical protein [Sneathiella litorea]MZR32199.1 hypothetical protein [Sneathiella litorea]